jgi:hypothetical protein
VLFCFARVFDGWGGVGCRVGVRVGVRVVGGRMV